MQDEMQVPSNGIVADLIVGLLATLASSFTVIVGKRRRLRGNHFTIIEGLGNYSPNNLQLGNRIFHLIHSLQNDRGALAKLLKHERALFEKFGGAMELAGCRNLHTLTLAVRTMRGDLLPFVQSVRADQGAVNNDLHAYMLFSLLESGAIIVRKTGERPEDSTCNPVTISFFVQSYQAAQKVQRLLLLLGEDEVQQGGFPQDTRGTFIGWQNIFKNRGQKPDVEIHLDNVHTWSPVPHAFVDTPVTSPEAWQILAKVFRNLETHPTYKGGHIIKKQFNPPGPTVFGTLRIHHGILAIASGRNDQEAVKIDGYKRHQMFWLSKLFGGDARA